MNSRERVLKTISHVEPDRIPIDLGGTIVSGIMAGALVRLREHLGLPEDIKVYDIYQMLGEVSLDLVERFDIDVLPVQGITNHFCHIPNQDFKPWTLFDGTQVLMPGNFEVEVAPSGDWLIHENGDPQNPVGWRMPKDGYYFDDLRFLQTDPNFKPPSLESLRKSNWRRADETNLRFMQEQAQLLRQNTDKALVLYANDLGTPMVGSNVDWLILLVTQPNYVGDVFALAAEIALDNLKLYWQAMGENIDIITVSLMDYGSQNRELFSPKIFDKFHVPCYQVQCDWIHQNTPWKTFQHCCGSIPNLIEPLIKAGIEILNPVQTSAAGMQAYWLKDTFGDQITFWGGGVDTQDVFSFGSSEEVRQDVIQRINTFGPGGGFVWNPIHNIQHDVPPENILAAIETVQKFGKYPLQQK